MMMMRIEIRKRALSDDINISVRAEQPDDGDGDQGDNEFMVTYHLMIKNG